MRHSSLTKFGVLCLNQLVQDINSRQHTQSANFTNRAETLLQSARDGAVRRPPTQIRTIYFDFLRCAVFKSFPAAMRAHMPRQPALRHQTWRQVNVVVIQHLQRLTRKLLAPCCRLESLVCWFGWDDRTQSIGLGLE